MDFRHYANRGYNQVYYEGYDYKGADPFGIACTSEFSVAAAEAVIPSDEEVVSFAERVKFPVHYVGTPEFYHEMKAFGRWSRKWSVGWRNSLTGQRIFTGMR